MYQNQHTLVMLLQLLKVVGVQCTATRFNCLLVINLIVYHTNMFSGSPTSPDGCFHWWDVKLHETTSSLVQTMRLLNSTST